jgi:sec-independent protein translocase protein TatC
MHEELRSVGRLLLSWTTTFVLSVIFLCSFGVHITTFLGVQVPIFRPESPSIASLFFLKVKQDLLPQGVDLISISPISVFLVQIKIAALGGLILLFPFYLYSLIRYLSPALHYKEKIRVVMWSLFAAILFFFGVLFAYKFLILQVFQVFFSFNKDMNVSSFLAIDEFINWTLSSLFLTGVLFLLPLFMYILSVVNLVSSAFFISRWREVFVVFLIIAAIITPDVSGVSLILISIPMIALYTLGIILSARHERNKRRTRGVALAYEEIK